MDVKEDKRVALRRRTLKGVIVSFNGGFSAVDGALKNMSETGGLLVVKDGTIVPDTFTLYCELDGWKIECQSMRRHGNSIGFQYAGKIEKFKPTRHQVVSALNLKDTGQESSTPAQQVAEQNQPSLPRPVQKAFGRLGS